MRNVRVSEKRNVGDRVAADEEIVSREVFFHDFKRCPTAVPPGCENCAAFGRIRLVLQPEPRGGDVRFVTVLLEKEPLKNAGPMLPVLG